MEPKLSLLPIEDVFLYDLKKPFHPSIDLNILMKDEQLANMLTVVEVKDEEIALQYENGPSRKYWDPEAVHSFGEREFVDRW